MYSLIGPPGAGKSTQVSLLKERCDFQTIYPGGLLRQHASQDILDQIKRGELANHDYTNLLVRNALDEILKNHNDSRIILDGYPRALDQAQWLIEDCEVKTQACVLLVASDEHLVQALINRGRSDDQPEVITRRIKIFKQNISSLLQYYESKSIHVYKVNAQQSIEDVFKDVRKVLNLD